MVDYPDREDLADRLRFQLLDDPNIGEMRLFGTVGFMLNNNFLCGAMKDGSLMLRIGKERYETFLAMPNVGEMNFTGKPMGGMVLVDSLGLQEDSDLAIWIAHATEFVGTLPPK